YVRDNVLAPMGIDDADTKPSDDTPTLNYDYPAGENNGVNYNDRTLYAGGEGWGLSANDYAKFLIGLRSNDDVLSESTRQLMRDGFLGFMDPNPDHSYEYSQGMFGTYYGHGGDLGDLSTPNPTNDLNTFIMDFPDGVQVALLVNSDWGPVVPHG